MSRWNKTGTRQSRVRSNLSPGAAPRSKENGQLSSEIAEVRLDALQFESLPGCGGVNYRERPTYG